MARVLCVFFMVQCLLTIPMSIILLRDPPHVFYPRMHGGPDWGAFDRSWVDEIDVIADANGFVRDVIMLDGNNDLIIATDLHTFIITAEYIFYSDANSSLAVPSRLIPAWALEEGAFEEIFDHLALYNRYFSSIVAPTFVLIFVVFLIMQSLIFMAAVWLFGHWQKLSGNMTVRERFAVCTFASVPASALGLALGILFPLFHILLFQFGMIYFSYKAMKEYLNENSKLVLQVL